jgi:hypothetical protein
VLEKLAGEGTKRSHEVPSNGPSATCPLRLAKWHYKAGVGRMGPLRVAAAVQHSQISSDGSRLMVTSSGSKPNGPSWVIKENLGGGGACEGLGGGGGTT